MACIALTGVAESGCSVLRPKLAGRQLKFAATRASILPHSRSLSQQCRASAQSHSATIADPFIYLKDVADVNPPAALQPLLQLLQAKGYSILDPSQRQGIVPLLVPLALDPASGQKMALLRWPTPAEDMELPLVSIETNGTLLLQARTTLEYVNRSLAEEDALGSEQKPLAEAVADSLKNMSDGEALESAIYQAGAFAASGVPRLEVYVLKQIGSFPDILEQMALNHLSKGDEVSALVTGEYYAGKKHFPGFGRPFMFNSELLAKVGRDSEARDAARIALRSPWWTLGVPYQVAADLAGYGDTLLEFAQERISEEGRQADLQKGKAPAQVSLDQAAFLLDVATAENSWDSIRERLASLYEESGLDAIARFVRNA